MIYIGNVRIEPQNSLEELWQFANLSDAQEFSRISYRLLYAAIPGDPKIYKIYPSGRTEVKLRRTQVANGGSATRSSPQTDLPQKQTAPAKEKL